MAELISKAKMSLVASLSQRKMRRRNGLFVAEGAKSVADTLGFFKLRFAVASTSAENSEIIRSIPDDICYKASPEMMAKISSLSCASDIIAVYELPEAADIPSAPQGELSLVLDGVQDPGNLGTIVRSAHWFGVKNIYCSMDTVDIFNSKSIQATMGSIGHVALYYTDITEIIRDASLRGLPVYGTLLEGTDIYGASLSNEGLLLMGNEGKGLSKGIREMVSVALTIPPFNLSDHAESLNVGVATAVVLSQFRSRSNKF